MYEVNESILYGTQGICRIAEIVKKNFDRKMIEYYVLKPVFDDRATIFVPTQNQKLTEKMRRVLSTQEVYDIIDGMPGEDLIWIEDDGERKKAYQEILARGDCREMVRLIKTLYTHQQKLQAEGKKLHIADDHFLKDAERVLYDEFACVLNIERDEVLPLILHKIELREKEKEQPAAKAAGNRA